MRILVAGSKAMTSPSTIAPVQSVHRSCDPSEKYSPAEDDEGHVEAVGT